MSWFFFRTKRRVVRRVRRRTLAGRRALFEKHRESVRAFAHDRLAHFNQFYNLTYARVAIRNQRTRWGSCSQKGNLNFHYKIALLPEHLRDYVIVHELCHLAQMNHSAKFWQLVAQTIPNHTLARKELRAVSLLE